MIRYEVSRAYMSGYGGFEGTPDEADAALHKIMIAIAADVPALYREARRYGAPLTAEVRDMDGFLKHIRTLREVAREIVFRFPRTGQAEIALGGGPTFRTLAEPLARAFVRLVMKKAHYAGLEVNVIVS